MKPKFDLVVQGFLGLVVVSRAGGGFDSLEECNGACNVTESLAILGQMEASRLNGGATGLLPKIAPGVCRSVT